ncbi:MAG: ArsR family transcriptional regulator [Phenylobacterium sp.]|nr:MAG: ArsR family transcriptional regulator [Phenylobacterium sp.]
MNHSGSLRTSRVAARLTNAFTLDLVKLGGYRRDVIDVLLRTALLHANQAHIIRDSELQRRYASLDDDVPDDLRRPASINAIAASLRVPFETARRRIGGMAELGVCQITPQGVVVPGAVTNSPPYRAACAIQYDKVCDLYGRLKGIGLFDSLPAATPCNLADPPLRLVGRLTVEYVLRFTEPISLHIGDVVTGLVLMDLIMANTEHLPDAEAGTDQAGADGFVPDRLREPVPATALSRRLGVPQETVRRHLGRLLERDLCRKAAGGYLVPAEILGRGPFVQFIIDNQAHLNRMFAGLGEFGVLAAWEQERQRGAA